LWYFGEPAISLQYSVRKKEVGPLVELSQHNLGAVTRGPIQEEMAGAMLAHEEFKFIIK
jgi:hypothetical protein